MRIDVVSIFPDYLAPLDLSLVGKARRAGLLEVQVHDLRDWTSDRHRTVDDTPYGGGAGMVMKPDVWGRALDDILALWPTGHGPAGAPAIIVPTPGGTPFTQSIAQLLAERSALAFACGRYEGIDARVAQRYRDAAGPGPGCEVMELSVGDYVLNGGEVAALVMIEAVARLIPGVIGNPESLVEESHSGDGLLEYPVFTKPPMWEGLEVPEILTSGDHGKISRWRRDQSLLRTAQIRPDLVSSLPIESTDSHDRDVLRSQGFEVIDGRFQIDAQGMAE